MARAMLVTVGLLSVWAGAVGEVASAADVRTAMTPHRGGDLVKTIPISKEPWQSTRSVISLGPGQLGQLSAGEVLEAAADIQTTICIRPNPRHPGEGQPCVGKYHNFDPRIELKLVLAGSGTATGPAGAVDVSRVHSFECTERPGHRTRHCVHQIPFSSLRIDEGVLKTCSSCHLNLLVSAHHPKAQSGHKIVLGSSDDRKRIQQGRSQLSAVIHPSAGTKPRRTLSTRKRITSRPPVVRKGGSFKNRVVYSQKVTGARKGDQLLVEARPFVRNNGLPYATHEHFTLVVSTKRKGTDQVGKIAERHGKIGVSNGFTCTQLSSGHKSPCGVVKTGIVSVRKTKPFFINLVIGQEARGTAPQYRRWRNSHRTKILKQGGMTVRSFPGTMACPTCALTRGFQPFSPTVKPADPRFRKLVETLNRYAIEQGSYSCKYRKAEPRLVCEWRSSGRYGGARYECATRAFYADPNWQLKPCMPAIAAQLWERLEQRGDAPLYTGKCSELSDRGIRCSWQANHGTLRWCTGQAVYTPADRSWRIPPCQP